MRRPESSQSPVAAGFAWQMPKTAAGRRLHSLVCDRCAFAWGFRILQEGRRLAHGDPGKDSASSSVLKECDRVAVLIGGPMVFAVVHDLGWNRGEGNHCQTPTVASPYLHRRAPVARPDCEAVEYQGR